MAFSSGDRTWVVYQAPPVWNGYEWVNGERFFLSGHGAYQSDQGIELARDLTGLERESTDYQYDQGANRPGAKYQGQTAEKREIAGAVNILGDSPAELRRNKRRWMDAHPDGNPGKLWFFSSDSAPRYLNVLKSSMAGVGSLETDPSLTNIYRDLEWGWVSDGAYFKGYRYKKAFRHRGAKTFSATFYNDSTVPQVYPILYLPGPGKWRFSLGWNSVNFVTPTIGANEEARISFNPLDKSFLLRNKITGKTTNLWPSMVGQRPEFSLEAQTKNTMVIELAEGNPADFSTELTAPQLVFTPEYHSWT